jgi:DNA-directed RNA polymerase subunit RPC12/RpoP
MQIARATPTCTRLQTSMEMPCLKCGRQMRLVLIEPRIRPNFEMLTYRCALCESDERFLMAVRAEA